MIQYFLNLKFYSGLIFILVAENSESSTCFVNQISKYLNLFKTEQCVAFIMNENQNHIFTFNEITSENP